MTASPDQAEHVVEHLEARLGLSFTGPRRTRLLATIEQQRGAAGLTMQGFLDAVSRPGDALDRLIAVATVGETSFFRDRSQCRLLQELVLPDVLAHAGSSSRVIMWSAGCASGEEAYTLAALAETVGVGARCTVIGSDASARAIDRARAGAYGPWSLRSTTAAEKAAHFQQQGKLFLVCERLRQRTRFVTRNLLDGPPPPGRFQVVLCRNLLIYLSRDAAQRVAGILAEALTPDGWLITAAGDPPLSAPGLAVVRTEHGFAYRRSSGPAPAALGRRPALQHAGPRPEAAVAARSRPRRAPAPTEPAGRHATPEELAEQVRSLGDAGRLDEACRAAEDATQAHPLDIELRYLSGVVLLEAGRLEQAAAAAAAVVYLDARLAAAHLLLGQVEHARGHPERARRSFRNAARLLATAPDDSRVILAGDVPAGHLAQIASRYLTAQQSDRG